MEKNKKYCKHQYIPLRATYTKNANDEYYNTWFTFECTKCKKHKTIKTIGYDFITNNRRK